MPASSRSSAVGSGRPCASSSSSDVIKRHEHTGLNTASGTSHAGGAPAGMSGHPSLRWHERKHRHSRGTNPVLKARAVSTRPRSPVGTCRSAPCRREHSRSADAISSAVGADDEDADGPAPAPLSPAATAKGKALCTTARRSDASERSASCKRRGSGGGGRSAPKVVAANDVDEEEDAAVPPATSSSASVSAAENAERGTTRKSASATTQKLCAAPLGPSAADASSSRFPSINACGGYSLVAGLVVPPPPPPKSPPRRRRAASTRTATPHKAHPTSPLSCGEQRHSVGTERRSASPSSSAGVAPSPDAAASIHRSSSGTITASAIVVVFGGGAREPSSVSVVASIKRLTNRGKKSPLRARARRVAGLAVRLITADATIRVSSDEGDGGASEADSTAGPRKASARTGDENECRANRARRSRRSRATGESSGPRSSAELAVPVVCSPKSRLRHAQCSNGGASSAKPRQQPRRLMQYKAFASTADETFRSVYDISCGTSETSFSNSRKRWSRSERRV
mmetsp:Transcript_30949/g.100793  ORF Transcript_30949/g.100793 Transcript_30949/m.100793 type:complete len:514 (-) Transcript_30949:178-1719(-)